MKLNSFRRTILSCLLISVSLFLCSRQQVLAYGNDYGGLNDPQLNQQVEDLVSQMSTDEKIGQLLCFVPTGLPRLGIPDLPAGEVLHGVMKPGTTCFPQAIGLGATWDPVLMKRIGTVVAKEARAVNLDQAFSPMLGLARDPRWGRVEESYGEDPYLVTQIGVGYIEGLEGTGNDFLGPDHIITTAKHFVADGEPWGGENGEDFETSERVLRENFMMPFEAAVKIAHTVAIMPAHHAINGVPCHANPWLLTEVLRKEWGFQGFITSDMSDIPKVAGGHFYAVDNEDAAVKSISAGVDMELVGDLYKNLLPKALTENKISMDVIDLAVKRIVRAKIKLLGLSQPGSPTPALPDPHSVLTDPTHDQLALQAAQEALVLLKNDNQTLPLDKSKVKNILVTGPLAKTVNLGGYSTTQPQFYVNPVDGITADAGSGITVTYQKGCNLENDDESQIPAAVDAARNADVVIAVIGQTTDQAKENLDRDNLDLVGGQEKLVEALQSTGKPVVVVLENGAPLSIVWIHDHIPAILESWYLGQDAGKAIAQALFGEINPGGKMPVSVPRNVGQVPCYYNHLPITGPVNFYGSTGGNLFCFGQGLSYTTFAYSNIQIQPSSIGPRDTAQVSVQVTNSGQRQGDEVVQLYINQKFTSVLRPVEELRGFQRVSLQPGESKTVTLPLGFEELKFWKDNGWVTEPGNVTVLIGSSCQDIKQAGVLELTQ